MKKYMYVPVCASDMINDVRESAYFSNATQVIIKTIEEERLVKGLLDATRNNTGKIRDTLSS